MGMGQEEAVVIKAIAAELSITTTQDWLTLDAAPAAPSVFAGWRRSTLLHGTLVPTHPSRRSTMKNVFYSDIPPFLNYSRLAEEGGHDHMMHF